MGMGMQQVIRIGLSPQEYSELSPHQVMSAPLECGICGWVGRLQRHGKYGRWLQSALKLLKIAVARFLCPGCGGTTSLLPDFALSYRLMEIKLVDLYFRAESQRRVDFAFGDLLRGYLRRWEKWWPDLRKSVGCYFGPLRIRDPCSGWKGLARRSPERSRGAERAGGIAAANRILVEKFKVSLFGQYAIHARPAFARCLLKGSSLRR